ncbi:DUF4113 domain-containing protein [Burkholderia metallica]|uniref:DUF4113 domain-containing protein n=1 Tax=Burkholderia metallica TaxID=488729 RepID=UPI0020C6F77A|nr:DUF4113 domain-containing protein [Burkholderia metallica]
MQPQKQIVFSRSFGSPVMAFDNLAIALRDFAATAAGRMRKQNLKAGQVQVFAPDQRISRERKAVLRGAHGAVDRADIGHASLGRRGAVRVETHLQTGLKYAKAGVGVMLTELQAQGVEQGALFAPESNKRDRLMAALDAVNDRFGRNTLRVGNVEGHKAWHMAQNAKPPSYTTDWGDLPVVR